MSDLIATARRLATAGTRRPRQSDLRRAVSTAYYAMFHLLAEQVATLLVGRLTRANGIAWQRTYRALDHKEAKERCKNKKRLDSYSDGIKGFATEFVRLQEERHRADYDPFTRYQRSDVLDLITVADREIDRFRAAPAAERLLFITAIVFKDRP